MAAEKAWWIFALLSAFFAALTTIFAKIGVALTTQVVVGTALVLARTLVLVMG